jgi:transposase
MGTEIIESDQPPAGVDVAPGLESGPMTSGQDAAEAEFLFRWNSSQTIRRALAQGAILNHKLNRPDAEKYAQPVRSDAEIVVLGQDMTPFAKISVDDLKAKTYLAAKQSKQKVNPSNVSVLRSPDGKRVTAVLFSFPRHLPAGQPLITPNDKNVEFACKLTGLDLHADFDLRKMLNEKGPDL